MKSSFFSSKRHEIFQCVVRADSFRGSNARILSCERRGGFPYERGRTVTQGQQASVRRLRESGRSYTAIAAVTGLSVGTIKAYCSRNNIFAHQPAEHAACKYCGADINSQPSIRQMRFCSPQCRNQWWANNRDKRFRKGSVHSCAHCKREYASYNKESKYCSHPCYITARFGKGAGQP